MKTNPTVPDTNKAVMDDGLDRIKDSARFLGISVAMLYNLMNQGEIDYVKFGKARRIPHRSLVDFAARHLVSRDS